MAVASIAHAHVPVRIIVGVDTHKDSHVGHAKDGLGRALGHLEVPTTARGYAALLAWAQGFGEGRCFRGGRDQQLWHRTHPIPPGPRPAGA